MINLRFSQGELTAAEQKIISTGFARHTAERSGPAFQKERVKWVVIDDDEAVVAALTADILWDWMYIDELWVSEILRGQGLGKRLMATAESFARSEKLTGIWLWTQSWQAPDFYSHLGYLEFARFENFPQGYERIGFRKQFSTAT